MLAHLPPSPARQIGAALRRRYPKAAAVHVDCRRRGHDHSQDACKVIVILSTMKEYGCEEVDLVPLGKSWQIVAVRGGKDYCPVVPSHQQSINARTN